MLASRRASSTRTLALARTRALRPSAGNSADHRPGACGQLEWTVTHPETSAESVAKCGSVALLERLAERAGWTNSGRQRRPQILEVRVLRACHERAEAHRPQAGGAPQLGELAFGAPAHHEALISGSAASGIDFAGSVPERAEQRHLAPVIPHT